MTDNPLIASGGWCAPSKDLYTTGPKFADLYPQFPKVGVNRGGIRYDALDTRTEAEREASDYIRRMIERHIGDIRRAQIAVEDAAIIHALTEGYSVHFQYNYSSRFLGVAFEARSPSDHLVHHHNDGWWWEDD